MVWRDAWAYLKKYKINCLNLYFFILLSLIPAAFQLMKTLTMHSQLAKRPFSIQPELFLRLISHSVFILKGNKKTQTQEKFRSAHSKRYCTQMTHKPLFSSAHSKTRPPLYQEMQMKEPPYSGAHTLASPSQV